MTAAHEPRRAPGVHLSAEELSEVAEGRQDGAEGGLGPAPDVAEHLRDCARCRDEADAMADLLAALADLEQPSIPQDVALRIDAALAHVALTDMPLSDALLEDDPSRTTALEPSAHTSTTHTDATSRPSHASQRPPSRLDETRRPGSRGSSPRRSTRRVAGWALGSLALIGGLVGLATVIGSSGGTESSSSGTAASGTARYPENPSMQNGVPNADSAAQSTLDAWTRSVLSGTLSSAGSSGEHANAVPSAPYSAFAASSVSQCEANPVFAGRKVVGATSGLFGQTPAVLVVYASGDGSRSVYAVAYAAPCAPSDYRVLAQGTVPE